jgi:UDP-3-O-[3-hydroxymyristoyl] glucosamine N-acyltransferase
MRHPRFFERAGPFTVDAIAHSIGAKLVNNIDKDHWIEDIKPLQHAGPEHLSFFDNRKYLGFLGETHAGACIVSPRFSEKAPLSTIAMVALLPYQSFARALTMFYGGALLSKAAAAEADKDGKLVHPSARIGLGCTIEPGAVIAREAEIGDGTTVAAGAVIGYRVVVGNNCYIGANSTITHAVIGDGVIIHAGVRIGQDGFGFALSPAGHEKVPQIGSVIIGDTVEIGANSTIDRGSLVDTIIGEGTKIDNLVQIAHSVVIGRHCVIVAQSGIAGSTELGDFVVMGARSGVVGHVKIGSGAQIAGMAHVKDDVAAGAKMGGTPARPFLDWAREVAALKSLGRRRASH